MIDKPRRILPWVWVGLAFAGTLLSKYHAIFLPIGAVLYIALTPRARPLLWRPGPYVALAIGALGFVPVLIWNAQNDWLSFAFQGRRAVGIEFNIAGVLTTLLGPIVYLFPWTWLLLMGMLLQRLWRWRTIQEIDRLLVCLALVPILFFLAVSFVRPVLPHWSLLGFVILFPFAGAKCAEWSSVNPSRVRRRIAGIAAAVLLIAGLALVQARFGVVSFPSKDPLIEASGWSSVPAELKARGLIGAPKTFLFTDRWYDSGQLAFAVRNEVPVLCYNSGDAHGFAQWSNPNDWIGWDGVLITTRDCPEQIRGVREYFEKVELATEFPMTRGGTPFRQVRVWRCTRQERPFPFRYGMN